MTTKDSQYKDFHIECGVNFSNQLQVAVDKARGCGVVLSILDDDLDDEPTSFYANPEKARRVSREIQRACKSIDGKPTDEELAEKYLRMTPQNENNPAIVPSIEGKSVMFIGELTQLPRHEAQALVWELGGVVWHHVDQTLRYLVCGQDETFHPRDVAKACDLKKQGYPIQLLDEEQFLALIGWQDRMKATEPPTPIAPITDPDTLAHKCMQSRIAELEKELDAARSELSAVKTKLAEYRRDYPEIGHKENIINRMKIECLTEWDCDRAIRQFINDPNGCTVISPTERDGQSQSYVPGLNAFQVDDHTFVWIPSPAEEAKTRNEELAEFLGRTRDELR